MYDIMKIQVPTTADEARAVLRTFNKDYDGGFNPDDRGDDIVFFKTGERCFDDQNAEHFDKIMDAVMDLLGEEAYVISLQGIEEILNED